MNMQVRTEIIEDIAVVAISNPPVNALSHDVRVGLLAAIAQTESDHAVTAILLICDGRTFIAGADIREFNKPPAEPYLHDIISALEAVTKPWIASMHGTALGGGLEVALGCHYRLATPRAKLGLPEVTLGLIPGAGGTVRLPRLIGPAAALDMIAGGKPVSGSIAEELGLVDALVDAPRLDGIRFARGIKDQPLPVALSRRPAPTLDDAVAWSSQCAKITARAPAQQAPVAAVEAVNRAIALAPAEALSKERATFLRLKAGDQSAALRYMFFAERGAGSLLSVEDVPAGRLTEIGVIGGGTMGAGIAAACLLADLDVILIEQDSSAVAKGKDRIATLLDASLKRGLISTSDRQKMGDRLSLSIDYAALASADLVIEAVFEDMAVKHEVFRKLDSVTQPGAILASNTSYLDINQIAQVVQDPSRVVGLHFFSPAHIMKLLELVITDQASPKSIRTGLALGKRLRKITVPAGVCEGFIGNRIMSAYRRACDYMLEDGALPWTIDAALRDFGFPMGIYEMQDMAGLDISWAMRKRQTATRDPDERYVTLADQICELGRFGRKTDRGWYLYDGGGPTPDPEVEAMVQAASDARGILRRPFSAEEIIDTILRTMHQTGEAILKEGIAQSREDIDVVMVNGYGFPRWRGGPMYMQQSSA